MYGHELNFDGIVGPTHNYSGLSYGNVASLQNQMSESNPKHAALQGLKKMLYLSSLGVLVAVLPPHERPYIPVLRSLGFEGSDEEVLVEAWKKAPEIVLACSSSAAMWTANCATMTPSIDTGDSHTHFTPANLSSKFHRSIEASFTTEVLQTIFYNPVYFKVHTPLPSQGNHFGDEGAANHSILCAEYGSPGIHFFVYGRYAFSDSPLLPKIFPARQTFEASQAIMRRHRILPERTLFAQQSPRAIDGGVFHNDVVFVANKNVIFYHEDAFTGGQAIIESLKGKVEEICDVELITVLVPRTKISLEDAVTTYLFNSQLISLPDKANALICPIECRKNQWVYDYLQKLAADPDHPIRDIHYIDLRESMRNGGGPACLRFRVHLTETELDSVHKGVIFTERLYNKLKEWVNRHYRDKLHPRDLADPLFLQETRTALDELSRILSLGSIYPFQR